MHRCTKIEKYLWRHAFEVSHPLSFSRQVWEWSTFLTLKVDSIIINSDLGTRTIEFSPDYVI